MGVTLYMSSLFQSSNKGGSMTCHVSTALDIIFLLQRVHKPILEGMRDLVAQENQGNLWHGNVHQRL